METSLLDFAPFAMMALDDDLNVVYANRPAAEFLHPAEGNLTGQPFLSLLPEQSRDIVEQKLRFTLTTGKPTSTEFSIRDDIRFGIGISRADMEDGFRLIVSGRNIVTVSRSLTRYRHLFHQALEPIVIAALPDGLITDCNEAFEQMMQESLEHLVGRPVNDLFGNLPEIRSSDSPVTTEIQLGERNFFVSAMAMHLQGKESLVYSFRDLSDLRLAEALYREVFFRTRDPLMLVDRDVIAQTNPAFEVIGGTDVVGRNWNEILLSPSEQQLHALQLLGFNGQIRLLTSGGDPIPVSVSKSPIDAGGARILIRLSDLRPTLEQKSLERSQVQNQKLEALGQMAAGVAHEFNNTLMASLPWAELLRKKYGDDETIQTATAHIRRAVQRARDVTRQLLDFAQPKRPQIRPVNLSQLVRDQLTILRPALPPTIHLTTDHLDDSLVVASDPGQLGQCLLNLALNARDAMPPEGGQLRIGVRRLDADDPLAGHVDGPAALLTVSDTGVGMPAEVAAKAFDPFFTSKPASTGSGLGLAVTHRILQEHGARVLLESEPGKGTTVRIVFPLADSPASKEENEPEADVRLTGRKVWIIDDEISVANGLASILELEGARVTIHPSGTAALDALKHRGSGAPDLVILDMGLPDIPGERVHGKLREQRPRLPILISSGYSLDVQTHPFLKDPATRYCQKPFEAGDLLGEIATLLQKELTER